MTKVASFTFSPFTENTYVVYDDTKECVIVDPGCFDQSEREQLKAFIESEGLTPKFLLNTHCHLDHIFGNGFVSRTYNVPLIIHEGELEWIEHFPERAAFFGITDVDPSPLPDRYVAEGDSIEFGKTKLDVLFTPGHSAAHIAFYCEESSFVLAGDVLFNGSIGRVDLPGGDMQTLMTSIETRLMTLPDETTVYAGHMSRTTIGQERKSNPYWLAWKDGSLK